VRARRTKKLVRASIGIEIYPPNSETKCSKHETPEEPQEILLVVPK